MTQTYFLKHASPFLKTLDDQKHAQVLRHITQELKGSDAVTTLSEFISELKKNIEENANIFASEEDIHTIYHQAGKVWTRQKSEQRAAEDAEHRKERLEQLLEGKSRVEQKKLRREHHELIEEIEKRQHVVHKDETPLHKAQIDCATAVSEYEGRHREKVAALKEEEKKEKEEAKEKEKEERKRKREETKEEVKRKKKQKADDREKKKNAAEEAKLHNRNVSLYSSIQRKRQEQRDEASELTRIQLKLSRVALALMTDVVNKRPDAKRLLDGMLEEERKAEEERVQVAMDVEEEEDEKEEEDDEEEDEKEDEDEEES